MDDEGEGEDRVSPRFLSAASAFLNELAPEFACSVCRNDQFEVIEKLKGDYYPFIYSINYQHGARKRFRQWLCMCTRCGHVYGFGRTALRRWAASKGLDLDE